MGSSSGPKTASSLTGSQKKVAKQLGGFLEGRIGEGQEAFPDELIADLIPEALLARNLIGKFQPGGFDPQVGQAISQGLSGRPSFDISPEATAEFFQRGVVDPTLRQFEQQIAPRIGQGFAGLGSSFSSRKGQAIAEALEGVQVGLSSQLAQQQFRNQQIEAQLSESAAERQLRTTDLARSFELEPLRRSQALIQAASPFQLFEQQRKEASLSEFLRTLPENNPIIQQALQFTSQNQTVQQAPRPGIGGAVGTLAGGALGFAAGGPVGAGAGAAAGGQLGTRLDPLF